MGRKNHFVQDTEVLVYRLQHDNVSAAKQLLERISLVADSLAEDVEEGQKKRFLEGTSRLMTRFRNRISELEAEGKTDHEIAERLLEEMNEHFTHDLQEFSLAPEEGAESVDWESTADELQKQNQWLREELERAEKDYMELYREAESDGEANEAR